MTIFDTMTSKCYCILLKFNKAFEAKTWLHKNHDFYLSVILMDLTFLLHDYTWYHDLLMLLYPTDLLISMLYCVNKWNKQISACNNIQSRNFWLFNSRPISAGYYSAPIFFYFVELFLALPILPLFRLICNTRLKLIFVKVHKGFLQEKIVFFSVLRAISFGTRNKHANLY